MIEIIHHATVTAGLIMLSFAQVKASLEIILPQDEDVLPIRLSAWQVIYLPQALKV